MAKQYGLVSDRYRWNPGLLGKVSVTAFGVEVLTVEFLTTFKTYEGDMQALGDRLLEEHAERMSKYPQGDLRVVVCLHLVGTEVGYRQTCWEVGKFRGRVRWDTSAKLKPRLHMEEKNYDAHHHTWAFDPRTGERGERVSWESTDVCWCDPVWGRTACFQPGVNQELLFNEDHTLGIWKEI